MADERTHSREKISTRRLEAFTDGVFAIAATLLVLDLSIDGFGSFSTNAQLWDALNGISSNLLSFLISFLLLCLLWSVHTRQFEHVTHVDSAVVALNSLRLLAVVLIPFSTSINSTYSQLSLGEIILPANFFFVVVLGSAQWFYLTRRDSTFVSSITPQRIRDTRIGSVIASSVAALVVIVAPFLGSWAFALFILNGPADRIAARIADRRAAAKGGNGR